MANKILKSLQFEENGDTYYPLPIPAAADKVLTSKSDGSCEWADPAGGGTLQVDNDGNGNITLSIA